MALLTILEYPDPKLRIKAQPVTHFDEALQRLIDDMFETMYEAPGIGLAATQVHKSLQLIVMDLSEDRSLPRVFINPKITPLVEDLAPYKEGCLSVPGFYEDVERPTRVHIQAFNAKGKVFEEIAEGLLAVCIQHECDHLNGKLFVDHISTLKRNRIKRKLEKQHKEAHAKRSET